jgi:hypothetical protein
MGREDGSKRDRWDQADTDFLVEQWLAGTCRTAIAERLQKSRGAVAVKANRLGLPPQGRLRSTRQADPAKKTGLRPCMCCGEAFPSEGIHHRLCAACTSASRGMIAPIIYTS